MVEPLLKWAGGKRWLVAGNKLPRPRSFERYVEPFLGSGAILFTLEPQQSLVADKNQELIFFYEVVRDNPRELRELMEFHHRRHSRDYYYNVRSVRAETKLERAAAFLYLNRTCWNGLYRVNLSGAFNVPIGSKSRVVMETDDFEKVSEVLNRSDVRCSDFEAVIDECGAGDFIFVDPPYTVKHNNNGFLKYNEDIFSWDDQVRLSRAVGRAVKRGAAAVVTNADHISVRDLYRELFSYTSLSRHSVLAAKAAGRRATTEAIFTANL